MVHAGKVNIFKTKSLRCIWGQSNSVYRGQYTLFMCKQVDFLELGSTQLINICLTAVQKHVLSFSAECFSLIAGLRTTCKDLRQLKEFLPAYL